jgi:hypothetical protein
VVGIANTTTIRADGRTLWNTGITGATSVEEAVAMLRTGKADAWSLPVDTDQRTRKPTSPALPQAGTRPCAA